MRDTGALLVFWVEVRLGNAELQDNASGGLRRTNGTAVDAFSSYLIHRMYAVLKDGYVDQ